MTILALYLRSYVTIAPTDGPVIMNRFRFHPEDRNQDRVWQLLPGMAMQCTACGEVFAQIPRGEWVRYGHGCAQLQPFLLACQARGDYADMIAPLYMHELITNG